MLDAHIAVSILCFLCLNSYARSLRPRWLVSVVLEEVTAEGFIVSFACAEVTV